MNNFTKHLHWTDFFKQLQEYGSQYIDEHKALSLSRMVGDSHTIIFRQTKDFPKWMQGNLPLDILVIQLFAMNPKSIGMVHKDGIERKAALNIPVINCNNGYMDWFTDGYEQITIDTDYTKIRITTTEKNFNEFRILDDPAHHCKIDVPSLVNTDVWHRIDNSDNENYRYMLSIRFVGNPEFTDLVRIFDEFYPQ